MRPVRAFPPEKTSSIATTCKQRATCTGRGTAITMSDSDASSDPEDFEYIPEGSESYTSHHSTLKRTDAR